MEGDLIPGSGDSAKLILQGSRYRWAGQGGDRAQGQCLGAQRARKDPCRYHWAGRGGAGTGPRDKAWVPRGLGRTRVSERA